MITLRRGLPEAETRCEAVVVGGDEPIISEVVVCEVASGLRTCDVPRFEASLEPAESVPPAPRAAPAAER